MDDFYSSILSPTLLSSAASPLSMLRSTHVFTMTIYSSLSGEGCPFMVRLYCWFVFAAQGLMILAHAACSVCFSVLS